MLQEIKNAKSIKMTLLGEKELRFISRRLLSIKVTPVKSQSQLYLILQLGGKPPVE